MCACVGLCLFLSVLEHWALSACANTAYILPLCEIVYPPHGSMATLGLRPRMPEWHWPYVVCDLGEALGMAADSQPHREATVSAKKRNGKMFNRGGGLIKYNHT